MVQQLNKVQKKKKYARKALYTYDNRNCSTFNQIKNYLKKHKSCKENYLNTIFPFAIPIITHLTNRKINLNKKMTPCHTCVVSLNYEYWRARVYNANLQITHIIKFQNIKGSQKLKWESKIFKWQGHYQ